MARIALPPLVFDRPFVISDPLVASLGRGRLLGPDLYRPTRSVRSPMELVTVAQRAWAFSLAMPADTAFSHETAARILNLPLPAREMSTDALHVIRDNASNRIRRSGVVGHRGRECREVIRCRGLEVVAPGDTFLDLAATLCRGDLVVLGDCIATRAGCVDPLHDAMFRRARLTGRLRAANALDLVRVGSASPMETRTRLLVVGAGLPEPALNTAILDRFGGWVATGDLVWKEQQVVGEFQGRRAHDGLVARRADFDRRTLLEDLGWTVIEIFFEDIVHPARRHRLLTRLAGHLNVDPRRLRLDPVNRP